MLSPELVARIGRDLAPARQQRSPRWHWWAFALPATAVAAAFALAWGQWRRAAPPAREVPIVQMPPADVLTPVKIESVLYSARNEGLVHLTDGTPSRRERRQFVDTIIWESRSSKVSITWTLPREEVRLVRVVYQ
jgi:hypothetical protein